MDCEGRCQTCGFNHPKQESSSFCAACRNDGDRRRFCIAFHEQDVLKPFIAADDMGCIRDCSRKLSAQGHRYVTLEWSDDQARYRVI